MHPPKTNSFAPLSDSEIGVTLLRSRHPRRYAAWVLVGITMTLVGYSLTIAGVLWETGLDALPYQRETWVIVLCLLALRQWSAGRIRGAGSLVLTAVVLETHATFLLSGSRGWPIASLLVPLINFVAGLWIGRRFAISLGATMVVTVPLSIYFSGVLGLSDGLQSPGMVVYVASLAAVTAASLLLLMSFLRALGEVLRRSEAEEQRARELIDGTPDAIVVLAPDGRVDDINDATERLLGLERGALLGRHINDLPLAGPDGVPLSDTLAHVAPEEPIELHAGMGRIPLETLVRPLSAPDGTEGKLLVLRDISKRRAAEAEARHLQAQLQQAQKMEAVGLLAGGIAHDFNNLLTAVGGYGSLLAMSTHAESREYGTEILSVQERGAALVRQLLTFARRDTARPRALDLSALIQGCAPLVERLVGERITLKLATAAVCPVVADPGRIEQALLNLAANARDAMPNGGHLWLRTLRMADHVALEIEDNGEGIPPAVLERVFEPFFTTKCAGKGTGLGLAAVHGIVTAAGGTAGVTSTVGAGTCVTLTFPATALPVETEPSTVRSKPRRARRHAQVLLVEDNDGVRTYLKRLLEHAGYRVEVARSGSEAWARLGDAAAPPDFLLSDVIMPGLTGPELTRLALQRWPGLRFLLMSGYLGDGRDEEDLAGLHPEGNLLMKPFSDDALLERLEHALDDAAAIGFDRRRSA